MICFTNVYLVTNLSFMLLSIINDDQLLFLFSCSHTVSNSSSLLLLDKKSY